MKRVPWWAVLAVTGLAGCSTQQLQGMNQQLAGINQSMVPGELPMPQPTAAQQQQLLSQINHPQTQVQMQTALQQASPIIRKVVQFLECFPGDPGNYLEQYAAPGSSIGGWPSPLMVMNNAPKTMCVNVVRMDDWQMPALNALSFRVVYQSSVSGETDIEHYTFQRQPDGTWLLLNRYR